MKYVIYIAIALLIVWSAYYLVRNIRRQIKGDCSACGGGCGGCNGNCGECSSKK